jgi:cell pole-organizing protein PopZ
MFWLTVKNTPMAAAFWARGKKRDMNSPNPQHEPTMEEILDSIRKIISEDQPESSGATESAPEPLAREELPQVELTESDVLDLTEEIREEAPSAPSEVPKAEAPKTQPPPAAAPKSYAQPIENDIAFETIEERESSPMETEDLISDTARGAVTRAVAPLDEIQNPAPAEPGTLDAVFIRAVQDAFAPTLQEWVDGHQTEIMDHLKPMIREWMDEHLPPLIEAAVAKEITRAIPPRRR